MRQNNAKTLKNTAAFRNESGGKRKRWRGKAAAAEPMKHHKWLGGCVVQLAAAVPAAENSRKSLVPHPPPASIVPPPPHFPQRIYYFVGPINRLALSLSVHTARCYSLTIIYLKFLEYANILHFLCFFCFFHSPNLLLSIDFLPIFIFNCLYRNSKPYSLVCPLVCPLSSLSHSLNSYKFWLFLRIFAHLHKYILHKT